jgi:translation initiation factor IF-3
MDHARNFLIKGDRVKVTVVFRGREITHIEFGARMLDRASKIITDLATPEMNAKMEGRNLISIFVPDKIKIRDYLRKQELERKRSEKGADSGPEAVPTPAP